MAKLVKGVNDLATVNPKLAKQWHPSLNGNLRPTDVMAGSDKKIWWLFPYDVPMDYPIEHLRGKHFDFEWKTRVSHRNNGSDCPYLTGRTAWKGFNDLATVNPELAAQWHPTKNGNLTPEMVTAGSHKKVWWILPYDDSKTGKHYDFEWFTSVEKQNKGKGCPYLTGHAVWKGYNDLETLNPKLAKEWHPTKNGDLTPDMVTVSSGRKIWWILPYDDPETGQHFDFEWESLVIDRTRMDGNQCGCPFLSGHDVWPGYNDLSTTHPDIAAQWHPAKNGKLKPEMVTAGSDKKVWWHFPYDVPIDYPVKHLRGKHFDFEWQSAINNRVNGNGCPFLVGKAVWKGYNDLTTTHPKLAAEWHPTKNGNLTPEMVTACSNKKVWWLLPYDDPATGKHHNFEWLSVISARSSRGDECPFLAGKAVWRGYNDLVTTHPDLAKEWHPTKNGNLTPDKISFGSTVKIWWKLPYDDPATGKHFDFEWITSINHRASGSGCPYLTGNAVWRGFNDLATKNPELAAEWHPTKNGKLKPSDVTVGSGRKVWWYLPYDDPKNGEHYDFEWKAVIASRATQNVGCPFILSSKGEEAVRKILKSRKIDFKEQYTFKDRFYASSRYPLKDDFAIFDTNGSVVATIEFHGEQHYKPIDFAGKGKHWAEIQFRENQKRDKVKTEYLKKHGIRQLVIPYTEFNNVKEIVKDFIQELSKIHELYIASEKNSKI